MVLEMMYKIELEAVEPLRIGGMEDPRSGIHNPVATVGGKVVVPGSSLKGALRAELEQFLLDNNYNKQSKQWPSEREHLQPCIPAPRPTIDESSLIKSGKYRGESCHYPCDYEEPREGQAGGRVRGKCTKDGRANPHSICPVCYLLGAMGLPGFVRVPFLYAEISPEELYSSRIDRARSTVVEGTNRPYQLVPEGTKFAGNLVILSEDPVTGWKLGEPRPLTDKTLGDKWLESSSVQAEKLVEEYVVKRLESINRLGGYKSKGFGTVKIKVTAQ